MMSKMKWLAIVLVLCLLVSSAVLVSATTETRLSAEASKDGIQVSLTTTKDTYVENEAIDIILNIGNSTGKGIANVQTSITVPTPLTVAQGDLVKTYEELTAAQLAQNKLWVGLGDIVIPTEPPTTPEGGEDEGTGDDADNGSEEERDNTVLLVASAVVLAGSGGGLAYMLITGKIKFKKTYVLILLAGVMLFSLIPSVSAAEGEDDEKKLEVGLTITVAGQEITISAVVTWEEGKPFEITRGAAEEALSAFLWAYYAKGFWSDYESTGISDVIGLNYGGFSPMGGRYTTIEDATEDTKTYTVCSNYAWQAYWQVMGMPIFGDAPNAGSEFLWYYIETSVKNDHVDDLCVMRWHTYHCDHEMQADGYMLHEKCISKGPLEPYREPYDYEEFVTYTIDIEPVKEYFRNWKENLRPGDIIRLPGHIVTFAGDGWILDSGSGKYVSDYGGYNAIDTSFNINATTVENYFLPDGRNTAFRLDKYASGSYARCYSKNGEQEGIAVIRPLDSIFMDDGDGDPSNDPLNPDYYHPGVDRLNWQIEKYDTEPLPHSGYTIQDSAFTRMKYPMMNINRTVSVGPYGHAVKGETFTYSVEIINQSNDVSFVTTREDGYKGETFVDVPIVETLPDGVELVSTNATAVIGNKLYWTIDVAAATSYDCYYEVRATADYGYEIVNEGGWVGTIPSNRLVTTIAGKYLTEDTANKFIQFYESGADKLNSNDGYKISANVNQDPAVLAEQLYKLAGLNLDMPQINDLVMMFFDQEFIKVEGGLYGQANKSNESWMFTLKDATTNTADQVWHDMIMNGAFIGGKYLWTNRYEYETRRVDTARVDYIEHPGDFIVCVNLVNPAVQGGDAYKVESWKIIFHAGDGKFISLNSNGVLVTDDTHREVEMILTYDLFIGFRPSQAYEDIYASIGNYTGGLPTLGAADMAYNGDITPSTVKLADKYKERLTAITAADVPFMYEATTELGVPMFGNVYDYVGVDISTNALKGHTWDSLMQTMFFNVRTPVYDKNGWQTSYDIKYYMLDKPMKGYETIRKMLMYYDGKVFNDVNADGTKNMPMTSIDQLEIGDCIIFGGTGSTQKSMVYLGVRRNKHQFVVGQYSPIGGYYLGNWGTVLSFRNNSDFMDYFTGPITDKSAELYMGGTLNYGGYLVLRPSQGFEDINKRATRDLSEGVLTDYEKQLIANMKEGNTGSNRIHDFIYWAYGQAYVKVSDQFDLTDDKQYYWKCFPSAGNVTTDFSHPVAQMLVNRSWSGNNNGSSSPSKNYGLTSWDQFQIGDVLIGRHKPTGVNVYWAAVYMGNGKFMEKSGKNGVIRTYDTPEDLYTINNWEHIFVLRPDQIHTGATAIPRPSIKDKKLTAEEKKIIAGLAADYSKIGGNQLSHTVNYVYNAAGVDVAKYFTLSANDTYYALFNSKGAKTEIALNNVNYHRMLVDKSWGGSNFVDGKKDTYTMTLDQYQIGDIFVGRSDSGYWYAVYQGGGKFLVGQSGKSADTMYFNDSDKTIYAAKNWVYYFVLRPDQLTIKDEYGYLDPINFGTPETSKGGRELTAEEQAIIKALTPDECGGANYNKAFAVWIYSKINVNLSDIHSNVSGILNGLLGQGTQANPYGLKTEAKTYPLLVKNSWGGTKVAAACGNYFLAENQFKVGDILVGTLTPNGATRAAYWQALYQGDGKFLVELYGGSVNMTYAQLKDLVDGGTYTTVKGTTNTCPAWDSYAVIRYANILGGKPAHPPAPPAPEQPAEPPVHYTKRELTELEQKLIKELTAAQVGGDNYNLNRFAPWVYSNINQGNNLKNYFLGDDSAANVLNSLFNSKAPHKLNISSKYQYVLVPNSYGGTSIANSVGNYILPKADYKIGDILVTREANITTGKTNYWCAVYQGDGNFLVEAYGSAVVMTYEDLMAMADGGVYSENEIGPWQMYAVLRFSYVLPYEPEIPLDLRDLKEKALTEEEKTALATIAATDNFGSKGTKEFIKWAYAHASVGVSSYIDKDGSGIFWDTFKSRKPNPDKAGTPLYDMMVKNSYGGSYPVGQDYVLSLDKFQVGDLFMGRYEVVNDKGTPDTSDDTTDNYYFTGLYQGEGKFLVNEGAENSSKVTLMTFVDDPATTADESIYGYKTWYWYYVLRPNQLVVPATDDDNESGGSDTPDPTLRDMKEKALTEEEKTILSGLAADYGAIGGNNLPHLPLYAYKQAGIDVSAYFPSDKKISDVYWNLFPSSDKLNTENTGAFYAMLVPGSYDGYEIDLEGENGKDEAGVGTAVQLLIADYKVGDIFCGKTSSGGYVQALYQGNGQFLMVYSGQTAETKTFTDAAPIADNTWRYYFVLRPELLVPAEAPEVELGRELTEQEQAALAALSSADYAAYDGDLYNINRFAPWVFNTIEQKAVITEFLTKEDASLASAADIMNNAFYQGKTPGTYTDHPYWTLVVENSWGGTTIKEAAGEYVLAEADFKVGDILINKIKNPSKPDKSVYWSALYKGEGKFLVEVYGTSMEMNYADLMALIDGGTCNEKEYEAWQMYCVLRFSNILPPLEEEEEAPGRELTEAEQEQIAAITKDTWSITASWPTLSNGIYATIGVDYESTLSIANIFTTLFTMDAETYGEDAVKHLGDLLTRDAVAAEHQTTWDLVVADSWGGAWFDADNQNTLTAEDFQVGDILVARSTANPYWMFLYIGNDQFIAWNSSSMHNRGVTSMDLVLNSYLAGNGYKRLPATTDPETGAVTYDKEVATGEIRHYCIMRVGQILPPLEEEVPAEPGRELTPDEQAALAAIAKSSIAIAGSMKNVAPEIYKTIGFTYATQYVNNDTWGAFFAKDGDKFAGLANRDDVLETERVSYDMIVPDSWGGDDFATGSRNTLTSDDFKIGDILFVRTNSAGTYLLLYQGDNDFVVWNSQSLWNRYDTNMDVVLNSFLTGNGFKALPATTVTDPETGLDTTTYEKEIATGKIVAYCIYRVSRVLDPLPVTE